MPIRPIDSEEDLIQNYLAPLASAAPGACSLKDDCAFIEPTAGHDLVLTTDALVSGLHFFPNEQPEVIAWRALAVNVSDLAAKGATPFSYLMALSLPEAPTTNWMMQFASGLRDAQDHYRMTLIGGDTDRRAGVGVSVTITAMGLVPARKMVRRSTARAGDRIFVSGSLGDAALGLVIRRNREVRRFPEISNEQRAFLLQRFLRPTPRLELSPLLLVHATAGMDLSDGLAKDLGRMCKASGVGAVVQRSALPLSAATAAVVASHAELAQAPLTGGDDYEILATVSPKVAEVFEDAAMELGVPVTDIGEIVAGSGVRILDAEGNAVAIDKSGYDHF